MAQACQLSDVSYVFISNLNMSSLFRGTKDREIIGIIVENKHINGHKINLECVIITLNHGFLVFNVLLWPTVDINAVRFASGINIDRGPQRKLNTSNPRLNLIL